MKKPRITLHCLVALIGGSSTPSAHLPATMLGGGGKIPRKELTARATDMCRIILKIIKINITGFQCWLSGMFSPDHNFASAF
jgi:hypothetical protein